MLEKNRITRAEFLIMKYVKEILTRISDLSLPNIDGYMNLPSHKLNREEPTVLLWKMFESENLVAHPGTRGYFTHTLEEIEEAISESREKRASLGLNYENAIYYGLVACASERYENLKEIWEEKLK